MPIELFEGKNLSELHRAEVIQALTQISCLAGQPSPKKYYASRYSTFLWLELSGRPVIEWYKCQFGFNHAIRQIHDFYGWMAKSGRRGLCMGTLYRTVNFMEIPLSQRDGSKKTSRNIHIEHTVPVAVLEKFIRQKGSYYNAVDELHWDMISNSICVAMTHEEQIKLDRSSVPRSKNEVFNEKGERVGFHPFRRYLPLLHSEQDCNFRIVNVVDGSVVDLNSFTFRDHENTLMNASKLIAGTDEGNVYSIGGFTLKN